MISQGEVYWLDQGMAQGSAPAMLHPFVIVQGDEFNHSRIATTVVCLITSNLQRGLAPGNVVLEQGEANLTKKSVVNVSQLATVDKDELVEKIGSLSEARLRQVLAGIDLVLRPRRLDHFSPEE